MADLQLRVPSLEALPQYVAALDRGWSPDNVRGAAAAKEQLLRIAEDAQGFVALQDDMEARGAPVMLPDGTTVPRLPGFHRWIWDGQFCGVVGFRWQPGTPDLPAHVLGHVGYAIVPWKRGRGYATRALAMMLPMMRELGLPWVDLTTEPENVASRRVIQANGGVLVDEFRKPPAYGEAVGLRYRIEL